MWSGTFRGSKGFIKRLLSDSKGSAESGLPECATAHFTSAHSVTIFQLLEVLIGPGQAVVTHPR